MKIVSGNVFGFWMFVVASVAIVYIMNRSEKGKLNIVLRPIAGLDALEESVGRATEMGRPVHFSPGLGDIIGTSAPETLAALQILSYVTQLSARYDARYIVTIRMPNVFPLAQELVRTGYLASGKLQAYREDTVRFLSSDQDAYAAGVIGLFHQEQVASSILAGLYMGEALLIAQIPFFVAACDYTIIGEELFAAGAYVSGDKSRLGGIAGQDYFKLAIMAVIVLGTIMTSVGSTLIQEFITR
jgi:hypothetical protein